MRQAVNGPATKASNSGRGVPPEPCAGARRAKIRVAYLIDTVASAAAGTEAQLLETIRRLDRERFEPLLICLRGSPWLASNGFPCPIEVLDYTGFLKPGFPRVVLRLRSLLRSRGIQVLQTFFEDPIFVAFFAAGFSRTRPVLVSSRRDIGLGDGTPWYHALFKALLPLVNRRFDGILCNSANVREFVAANEKTPGGKFRVIANGVDVPPRTGPGSGRDGESGLMIGIVANLKPVKRIDVFLKALAILADTVPNFRAVVLGDGPEKDRLRRLSEDLGLSSRVDFRGSVSDVTPYLRLLDIGVLCSDREGLSNAILEYMASGLPVVATAVGGNTELVDGSNGFCVPPGDPDALAQALERLASDRELRKAMGRKSLEKVMDRFSWERSIRDLEAYYEELVRTE